MIVRLGVAALVSALGISAATLFSGGEAKREGAAPERALESPDSASSPKMIPARFLDCMLGRIANFDPNRNQAPSEYVYDGSHAFKLFLPSIPVRTSPPPESTSPPEPVDPKTRVVADPDGLTREVAGRPFDRVVDTWPERTEMTAPISDVAVNMIIIDQIDTQRATANLFMTKANDAVTFDLKHLYLGTCRVATGGAAVAKAD